MVRKSPSQEKFPLSRAILWISLSNIIVSTIVLVGWFYVRHIQNLRTHDDQYRIIGVVQTGPEKEALNTVYLEELLGLSIDKPTNLYKFNIHEAQRKLLASPLIKQAAIKKIKPGTIYIDYSIRQPIAYIGDFTNTAIDSEGTLIPFKPFFTPKKIPEIYLGLEDSAVWGTQLKGKQIDLAFNLLHEVSKLCQSTSSTIKKIDVSKAYSDSYGQRQAIVIIEDCFEKEHEGKSILCIFPRILRLSTENYNEELTDFTKLREYLQKQELQQIVDNTQAVVRASPMIINMRIPQLAFFKE